ncbi:MAG: transglutaminase domain-containing protein [Acidimicrobiia bacterium]
MRFEIRYRMAFEYENVVRHSQNEVRACPLTDEHQHVLSYRFHSTPSSRVHGYTDYWGTRVDAYGVREPHVAIEIVAESTVETRPRPVVASSAPLSALHDPAFREPLVEHLQATRHTEPGSGVRSWVDDLRQRSGDDVVDLVLAIHRGVHRTLRYAPGATGIGSAAEDVLEGGAGVCQDYAHLAVSACRAAGIPARYVSGYFFTSDDRTGEVSGDTASVQTHAWFEAAIPGAGWLALDPTNALPVGERHVTIGRGRDYDDVPPIRGVYSGMARATVDAGVEIRRMSDVLVTQQAQQQQ